MRATSGFLLILPALIVASLVGWMLFQQLQRVSAELNGVLTHQVHPAPSCLSGFHSRELDVDDL